LAQGTNEPWARATVSTDGMCQTDRLAAIPPLTLPADHVLQNHGAPPVNQNSNRTGRLAAPIPAPGKRATLTQIPASMPLSNVHPLKLLRLGPMPWPPCPESHAAFAHGDASTEYEIIWLSACYSKKKGH
jgi:hypothetical protein